MGHYRDCFGHSGSIPYPEILEPYKYQNLYAEDMRKIIDDYEAELDCDFEINQIVCALKGETNLAQLFEDILVFLEKCPTNQFRPEDEDAPIGLDFD